MTFKANWEKTHTRIHLSEYEIKQMLAAYYSENDIKSFHLIEDGCSNVNVLVRLSDSNTPIILRIYLRDKTSAYREQKISALLKGQLPVPEFYHIAEAQGHTFAITEYLLGIPLRDFLLSDSQNNVSQIMYKVGKALGVISNIKFPHSGFFNKNLEVTKKIRRDELVDFCLGSLEDTNVQSVISTENIDQIKALFRMYENFLPDASEKNLVHADFDPANILVIQRNGEIEVSGILDWEFSFSGSTLCDVAGMLRYSHNMPSEYRDSFLEGLLSTGYKLPSSWQITINLLNILSLLDCLRRSDLDNSPNQTSDIKELISHILFNLRKVKVVPYDSNWPSLFELESDKIKLALGNSYVAIHHIGSTSVPNLASKPTIDIIAEVKTLAFDHQDLTNLNYEYRGGFNLPLRKSFTYRSSDLNINLHIFEENDPEVELNLLFRDYLRSHTVERNKYAALKYQLLEDEVSHKKNGPMYRGYTLGKNVLIQDILKKSGFNRLRFVLCTHYTEWDATKKFRHKYFFEPNNIEDPYTWTFDHKEHKHFILYKGVNIVGYAHIQLLTDHSAAIRIIVIDEKHRGKDYGKEFMALIEKWLKLQGYKSVHTESSPAALGFYKRLNYEAMLFNDPEARESSPEDIAMGKLL